VAVVQEITQPPLITEHLAQHLVFQPYQQLVAVVVETSHALEPMVVQAAAVDLT
jgi:hypothetical protein